MAFLESGVSKGSSSATDASHLQLVGYTSETDTLAEIKATGYFDELPFVEAGWLIQAEGIDAAELLSVLSINPVVTTGIVANQNIANMASLAPTTTTINSMDTYELVSNPTIFNPISNNFSMPQDNRLQFDGAITTQCLMVVSMAINRTLGGSDTYAIAIFKNGIRIAQSEIPSFATQNAILPIGTNSIVEFDNGDFVEIKVKNITGTSDIDVEKLNVSVNN